jgi:hypothetical protein
MSFRTGGLAFWVRGSGFFVSVLGLTGHGEQIKDFTRPEMWPFVAGFGVVNLLAWKYLK